VKTHENTKDEPIVFIDTIFLRKFVIFQPEQHVSSDMPGSREFL
jgi:hypothetical protein